ncbi:MAG TPA: sigma factor [Acidimicrobiales bacterium]
MLASTLGFDGLGRAAGRQTRAQTTVAVTSPGFDEVFVREYLPMVRLATLLLGTEAEAEEVVQDAFAIVHERWDRLTRPGGYLRSCVVNRCGDILRRRTLARRLLRATPVENAELGADHLLDALATLPPKRRAAIVLPSTRAAPRPRSPRCSGSGPGRSSRRCTGRWPRSVRSSSHERRRTRT